MEQKEDEVTKPGIDIERIADEITKPSFDSSLTMIDGVCFSRAELRAKTVDALQAAIKAERSRCADIADATMESATKHYNCGEYRNGRVDASELIRGKILSPHGETK